MITGDSYLVLRVCQNAAHELTSQNAYSSTEIGTFLEAK